MFVENPSTIFRIARRDWENVSINIKERRRRQWEETRGNERRL
jgi:hypothetical protein